MRMKKRGEEGKQNIYLMIPFLKANPTARCLLAKTRWNCSLLSARIFTLPKMCKWKQKTIRNVGVGFCYNFLVFCEMLIFFAATSKVVIFLVFFLHVYCWIVFLSFVVGAKLQKQELKYEDVAQADLIFSTLMWLAKVNTSCGHRFPICFRIFDWECPENQEELKLNWKPQALL